VEYEIDRNELQESESSGEEVIPPAKDAEMHTESQESEDH
jgi:hypothetical protein